MTKKLLLALPLVLLPSLAFAQRSSGGPGSGTDLTKVQREVEAMQRVRRGHPERDRNPDTAKIGGLQQHTYDDDVAPGGRRVRPWRSRNGNDGKQDQDDAGEAVEQKRQRRRVWSGVLGHDKAGAPDKYERQWRGREPRCPLAFLGRLRHVK